MIAKVVLLVVLMAASAQAQTGDHYDKAFAGVYLTAGTGADGKHYDGFLTVEKAGETYLVVWEFAEGVGAFGYALQNGDVVSFICQGAHSVAHGHYRLGADGVWNGVWSGIPPEGSKDLPEVLPESLTPTTKTPEQLRKELKARAGGKPA